MKDLLALCGNVVFAASTVCGLFLVTAKLSAQEEQIKAPMSSAYSEGLWTREPTRVDPSAQHFERVEAAPRSALAQAKPMKLQPGPVQVASLDPTAGASYSGTDDSNDIASAGGPRFEHQQWCSDHYRSYDASDNSYRSFSGSKRTCVSPYSQALTHAASPDQQQAAADGGNGMGVNISACQARYKSYDVGTNTYQPFDGGPRRQCQLSH